MEGIDVQLKRRHDLMPNLVETVKGYARTSGNLREGHPGARGGDAGLRPGRRQGGDQLTQALGGLRVVAEQYPELRATENFQQLSRQLSELEDEIQASRRIYNSNVQGYNTKIQIFPTRSSRTGRLHGRSSSRSATPRSAGTPQVSFS